MRKAIGDQSGQFAITEAQPYQAEDALLKKRSRYSDLIPASVGTIANDTQIPRITHEGGVVEVPGCLRKALFLRYRSEGSASDVGLGLRILAILLGHRSITSNKGACCSAVEGLKVATEVRYLFKAESGGNLLNGESLSQELTRFSESKGI